MAAPRSSGKARCGTVEGKNFIEFRGEATIIGRRGRIPIFRCLAVTFDTMLGWAGEGGEGAYLCASALGRPLRDRVP